MWVRMVQAIEEKDLNTAQLLLQKDPTLIKQKSGSDENLLHTAIKAGFLALLKPLLALGIDVNARDDFGWSSVHYAAASEDEQILPLILAAKGNPNTVSRKGELPLHLACRNAHRKQVELLLKAGSSVSLATPEGVTPIHEAAYGGDPEIIRMLLAQEAKPKVVTQKGDTPLHLAAQKGRIHAAKLLIEKGVSADTFNKANQRYLEVAQAWQQEKFIRAFTNPEEPLPAYLAGADQARRAGSLSTQQLAAEAVNSTSESAFNLFLRVLTPMVSLPALAFVILFCVHHGANFLVKTILGAGTGKSPAYLFFFFRGAGLFGTDIPPTWWFFHGALILSVIHRFVATPFERKVIYFYVLFLLVFWVITPPPIPIAIPGQPAQAQMGPLWVLQMIGILR